MSGSLFKRSGAYATFFVRLGLSNPSLIKHSLSLVRKTTQTRARRATWSDWRADSLVAVASGGEPGLLGCARVGIPLLDIVPASLETLEILARTHGRGSRGRLAGAPCDWRTRRLHLVLMALLHRRPGRVRDAIRE